jgi:hypothetical protein
VTENSCWVLLGGEVAAVVDAVDAGSASDPQAAIAMNRHDCDASSPGDHVGRLLVVTWSGAVAPPSAWVKFERFDDGGRLFERTLELILWGDHRDREHLRTPPAV